MSIDLLRADAGARARLAARSDRIARQLARLRPEIRAAATALAQRHSRLADLAVSFPALLAALAWPNGRFAPEPAIAAVLRGAPLAQVAALARVPL